MKQIFQSLKNGQTLVFDVPAPTLKPGCILIRTRRTLISAGTERMLVDFGRGNWIEKAKSHPDKVWQVIEKAKTDGILPTLEAVSRKLDDPLPVGYCNVGVVSEVSPEAGDAGFQIGDRVLSNGPHAEWVCVPRNLCAKIPDTVSDEEAVFAVLGSIGLQGLRLASPTLGESFVVIGLGLIGLLTAQLLKANGCRVLGVDLDSKKTDIAKTFGIETVDLSTGADSLSAAEIFSKGLGVDGVLITASTESSDPVRQAAKMCRKRGRIVLVGVAGLELNRADFYEKELSFQVSCSYGPGRYDPLYEEKGGDYPFGLVRWTEQRNFQAVLQMLEEKKLNAAPLLTQRFPMAEAEKAYALIADKGTFYLGVLLEYPKDSKKETVLELHSRKTERLSSKESQVVIGMLGAGNYAGALLLPALAGTGARLKTIVSRNGVTAAHLGKKFGFQKASTEPGLIFGDPEINAVIVATRHDSHAGYILKTLESGKHGFVEKPLCLTEDELNSIREAHSQSGKSLMVGFNRRFAPQVLKMKELLAAEAHPKSLILTVNAGAIPASHWTQDPSVGGGRILGEACHFIDLLRTLADSKIESVSSAFMDSKSKDTATVTLRFENGSLGTVHYFSNGPKSFPKERLEVFCGEKVLQLDNFRDLHGFGFSGFRKMRLWREDKGHPNEMKRWVSSLLEGKTLIPFAEIEEVTRATLQAAKSLPIPDPFQGRLDR